MFRIDKKTKRIELTRGDVACIRVSDENNNYTFKIGDVVRFKVFKKGDSKVTVLQKDTIVTKEGLTVDINLTSDETKIGNFINKYCDYWYEVEVNPDTRPQTIIGYEIDPETRRPWEKIFRLLVEGGDK